MKPFFSIIIPVYNVAPYLRECLDSVRAQTFTDWECLCVNDGSTDESGAILDEYAQKDPRFRVFHKKNAGVSSARNLALDNVCGEWIGFLDGDDVWTEDALLCFRNGVRDNSECKILRGEYRPFDEDEKAVLDEYEEGKITFSILDIHEQIKPYDFMHYLFGGYFYKRSLIGNLRFPRYVRGEDRVFLAEILLNRVDSVLICNHYFYGYRQRRGSAVHQKPSISTLQDEMDHRLDLMFLIDQSARKVEYVNSWGRDYFLKTIPLLICYQERKEEQKRLFHIWKERLFHLQKMKALPINTMLVLKCCCSRYRLKCWFGLLRVFLKPYLHAQLRKNWLARKIARWILSFRKEGT